MKHSLIISLLFATGGISVYFDTDQEVLHRRLAAHGLEARNGYASELFQSRDVSSLQRRGSCGSKGCFSGSKNPKQPSLRKGSVTASEANRIMLEHVRYYPTPPASEHGNHADPSRPEEQPRPAEGDGRSRRRIKRPAESERRQNHVDPTNHAGPSTAGHPSPFSRRLTHNDIAPDAGNLSKHGGSPNQKSVGSSKKRGPLVQGPSTPPKANTHTSDGSSPRPKRDIKKLSAANLAALGERQMSSEARSDSSGKKVSDWLSNESEI